MATKMTLSVNKYSALVDFLESVDDEKNRNKTIEDFLRTFKKEFEASEFFKVCQVVFMLLEECDLLRTFPQRIMAISLLTEFSVLRYENRNLKSPFCEAMLYLLDKRKTSEDAKVLGNIEKNFMAFMMTEKNVSEILSSTFQNIHSYFSTNFSKLPNLSKIREDLNKNTQLLTSSSKGSLSVLLPFPVSGEEIVSGNSSLRDVLIGAGDEITDTFVPAIQRPAPPLYATLDELVWLNPAGVNPEFQISIDPNMLSVDESEAEAKKLLSMALDKSLTISQTRTLKSYLSKGGATKIGMTTEKLPLLVEHNTPVAIEILSNGLEKELQDTYFHILVDMELSLQSMEVVNRLTANHTLSAHHINHYIGKCIKTCDSIKDKYMQSRLVRLVCVFLQSLVRNKMIKHGEESSKILFRDIELFCVMFMQIREAAALFKLIKQLPNEEGAG